MGWWPATMLGRQFLNLSTQGGVRAPDGTPIALGYHTGHWEVGLLVEAAARALKEAGATPFAAACTDPCDGRSQGTPAMFDSLPYRNDAATVFGRLIRSLPTRRGAAQRHGDARRVRRLDQPAVARPRDCACRRTEAARRQRLERRQPPGASAGRRAAERPAQPPDRAGVPCRRRSRSDAAPAPR